jgi:flagellar biosynthesis protein FlhB
MADNNDERDLEDLSEEASPYRLAENRKKGQVAQSRELAALALLLATGMTFVLLAPTMGEEVGRYMKEVFSHDLAAKLGEPTDAWAGERLLAVMKLVASIGLPISIAGLILGIVGHLAQIGFIFSFEPITPNLDKINPISGLKRLFSTRQLWESMRVILKGATLLFVAFRVVQSDLDRMPGLVFSKPSQWLGMLGATGVRLFLWMVGVLMVFAGIDFWLQRREYGKQVRVTKQEAKQEAKEQDGDPLIKARIRSMQRDRARKRMMSAVKKADVIITNPTHIAIALVYDKDKMAAPRVVAKGADFLAQRIKKIAAESGIPMVENVPLARAIYKTVKVNHFIPRTLFQAVAEVLAYVYRLRGTDGQWREQETR